MKEAKKRPIESNEKVVFPKGLADAQCASNPRRGRDKIKERPTNIRSEFVKSKEKIDRHTQSDHTIDVKEGHTRCQSMYTPRWLRATGNCYKLFQSSGIYNFFDLHFLLLEWAVSITGQRSSLCDVHRYDRQGAQDNQHLMLPVPENSQSCKSTTLKFKVFHVLEIKSPTKSNHLDCLSLWRPCSSSRST